MEQVLERAERTYIRLIVKVFLGLVLFIGLIWGGNAIFHRLQARRLLAQAHASYEKGDDRWASIAARRVVELNPHNAEACRILARVMERQGHPSAVEWWREVVKLVPDSVEDNMALARSALRFGEISTAERVLQSVEARAGSLPVFHEIEAQLAVSKKDPTAAARHFAEAVRLDPQNKVYQLNLAVFQLQAPAPEERAQAMNLLRGFLDDPTLRLQAAHALSDYAVQRRDLPAILDIAALITTYRESTLRDRIFYLQVLHKTGSPDFAQRLTDLQNETAHDPLKLYDVLRWMSAEQLSLLALDWVKGLPPEVISTQPVPAAIATCYAAVGDWSGLQAWCGKGSWGENEYLRHAWLARSARESERSFDFKTEWAEAFNAIGSDGAKAFALEQEVLSWGWKNEAADLLWVLTKDPERQNNALASLYQYYTELGDTTQLYRVVARILELRPTDAGARNNFAQVALLLNVDTTRAAEIALQLHASEPANAIFASTYAFSLYLKGKNKEALAVMNKLPPEQLHQPAIALYYGLFLAATGDGASAQPYFTLAREARLLPEENALLAKSSQSVPQS